MHGVDSAGGDGDGEYVEGDAEEVGYSEGGVGFIQSLQTFYLNDVPSRKFEFK